MEDFDAWLAALFSPSGDDDDGPPGGTPVEVAERIRHLFGNAGALLGGYSDDQVARGLIEIVDGGELGVFGVSGRRQLPVVLRTTGLRSIVTLFAEIFAPRILVEDPRRPKLQYICFMFFDVAAIDLGDDTVLDVLEAVLALESVACQRSALHGLGHAYFSADRHATAIVDRWLQKNRHAPQDLREYAASARVGDVM